MSNGVPDAEMLEKMYYEESTGFGDDPCGGHLSPSTCSELEILPSYYR